MSHTDHVEIQQQKPDHHFRTEIPNIVFEVHMEPHVLAVYVHLKRIAGDSGQCWRSMRSLAALCGVGETKLRECLDKLADANRYIDQPLITIYHRKKPDGSKDSNVIVMNDLWRMNGNYFRAQSNDPMPSVGGTSPREGGVARQTREGTSPREDKEQPSKEEPSKETNKQPVVVCSSLVEEEKKKMQLLFPYHLPQKMLRQFLNLSIEHLQDAIAAFEQYKSAQEVQGGKLDNPIGALRNAIVGAWKPNVTKADKEKAKETQALDKQAFMDKNHEKAMQMFNLCCKEFNNDFNFSVSDNVVSLKYKTGFFPLAMNDEAFESILDYYITSNLKK